MSGIALDFFPIATDQFTVQCEGLIAPWLVTNGPGPRARWNSERDRAKCARQWNTRVAMEAR